MKTRSFRDPIDYVWSNDPAVDPSIPYDAEKDAGYSDEKYREHNFDAKYRPTKEEPAKFRLAPLSQPVMQRVMKLGKTDQLHEAVAHSLVGVSNWEHNGRMVSIDPKDIAGPKDERRLTDEWIKDHYDPLLWLELGDAALSLVGIRPF